MILLLRRCNMSHFRISLSTKWKKSVLLFAVLIGGLLLIANELTKPKFLSFEKMSSMLVPSRGQHDILSPNTSSYCEHVSEKMWSTKRIEIFGNISDEELSNFAISSHITNGGFWSPENCLSKYQINILIPYRERPQHLRTFLHYIHRFLPNQLVEYRIFIVEQTAGKPFNRGKLLNAGFIEAQKQHPVDCYIFHDVTRNNLLHSLSY